MTPEQAKIVVLEEALIQAIHTIEFLNGCLLEPSQEEKDRMSKLGGNYSYGSPEQTTGRLKEFRELVKVRAGCFHSYYAPGRGKKCEECEESLKARQLLYEAKEVLKQ